MYSQNFVYNPGFEEINPEICVEFLYLSDMHFDQAIGWDSPFCRHHDPYLFSPCGLFTPDSIVITSDVGMGIEHKPRSGLCMSSMIPPHVNPDFINSNVPNAGSILRNKLIDTFQKDSVYIVTINVCPYDTIGNGIRNLIYSHQVSVHFSPEHVDYTTYINSMPICDRENFTDSFQFVNQTLSTPPGLIIDNPGVWRTFCWTYKARGNEAYLMLGSFVPWQNRAVSRSGTAALEENQFSYYYFDDISVEHIPTPLADPLADTVRYLCSEDSLTLRTRPSFGEVTWQTPGGEVFQDSLVISEPGWYVVRTPLVGAECCETCGEILDSVRVIWEPSGEDLLATDSLVSCPDAFPIEVSAAFTVEWPG